MLMKILKDIRLLAFPEKGYAKAEGESAEGMVFMKRQYGQLDATVCAENVNDFLDSIRKEGLTCKFTQA